MNRSFVKILSPLTLAPWMIAPVIAFAEVSNPVRAASQTKVTDTKPNSENIDEEITNARMRADSGSKSKLSLSLGLSYTGASVEKPLSGVRPNLSSSPGHQRDTSANVGMSGRYRWSKNDSMTLGTSFGIMTPLQGDKDKNNSQLNVFDPGLGYSHVGKHGPYQTTAGVGTSYGTSQSSMDTKYLTGIGLSANALRPFGRLTLGSSVSWVWNVWANKPGEPTKDGTSRPGYYGGDTRSQWSVGVFPYAEYQFSDRISARTVFGYFNWRHLYGDSENRLRLLQTFVYQSVGLGISVTRDVYLYPNIQFVPDNARQDFTNVALSASINIF